VLPVKRESATHKLTVVGTCSRGLQYKLSSIENLGTLNCTANRCSTSFKDLVGRVEVRIGKSSVDFTKYNPLILPPLRRIKV